MEATSGCSSLLCSCAKEKGLLSVTPIWRQRISVFSWPSSIFERTDPRNVASLPSKCILFCHTTSNGVVRSCRPGSADCLTGSCIFPAPSTSAVFLRGRSRCGSLRCGLPGCGRVPVDRAQPVPGPSARGSHLQLVPFDHERLGLVGLCLGECTLGPLEITWATCAGTPGTSAEDADIDRIRLHDVGLRGFAIRRQKIAGRDARGRFAFHGRRGEFHGRSRGAVPAAAGSASASHLDVGTRSARSRGAVVLRFERQGSVLEPNLQMLGFGFELAADHGHFFHLLPRHHVVELGVRSEGAFRPAACWDGPRRCARCLGA